jgi:hypothetical protein
MVQSAEIKLLKLKVKRLEARLGKAKSQNAILQKEIRLLRQSVKRKNTQLASKDAAVVERMRLKESVKRKDSQLASK